MDLFKWTKNIKPKFPNVVERFFGKKIDDQTSSSEEIATVPAVNINDKNKAYEVSVAIPGIDKKEIKLEVKDHCLIISSEKQYEKEENEGHYMRREYGYASFQRMFQLPENADLEQVDASMKNGVLKVKVGKREGQEFSAKSIEIK
jgi:HSP20 family protein